MARVPVRELQKACEREREKRVNGEFQSDGDGNDLHGFGFPPLYLHRIPKLVLQVVIADALWVALRQKHTLKLNVKMSG